MRKLIAQASTHVHTRTRFHYFNPIDYRLNRIEALYWDHMTDHLYVAERVGGVWKCVVTPTTITCDIVVGGTKQATGVAVHKGFVYVGDGISGVRRIWGADATLYDECIFQVSPRNCNYSV
jgi:hypothetical protein